MHRSTETGQAVASVAPSAMGGGALGGGAMGGGAVQRLLDSAERFLVCRDRARAHAPWAEAGPPEMLAEAIARDFAGFDLEQAEAEFRAALAALSGGAAPHPTT